MSLFGNLCCQFFNLRSSIKTYKFLFSNKYIITLSYDPSEKILSPIDVSEVKVKETGKVLLLMEPSMLYDNNQLLVVEHNDYFPASWQKNEHILAIVKDENAYVFCLPTQLGHLKAFMDKDPDNSHEYDGPSHH